MPDRWKVGLIKLIPKVPSPTSFHQWRPNPLIVTLANRLKKILPKLHHPTQYSFNVGRNILHNILNFQMTTDYVKHTGQEMVMVNLDLERPYACQLVFPIRSDA